MRWPVVYRVGSNVMEVGKAMRTSISNVNDRPWVIG